MIDKWFAFFFLLLLCAAAAAYDEEIFGLPEVELPEPIELNLEERLDEAHEVWSERVKDAGIRLDRLFGGEEFVADPNSYVRIRTIGLLQEGSSEAEVRVRARLALPNTERRFSLVLDSDDDERFDQAGGDQPSPPGLLRSSRQDGGFTAGLRYLGELSETVNFDTDVGIRARHARPDPYVRARIRKSFYPGKWELRPLEEVYWRYHKGQGVRSQVMMQRILPNSQFFRSTSEVDWVYRERRTYASQDFTLTRELSPLHAVQSHIGIRGESDPMRVVQWFVNVGWRRNIYRDWLFLELRPELLFDREEDFRAEPRLFLILESYFGASY